MNANKSLLVVLRISFVIFTLQFLKDAFYKWDGYSFYMRFAEFLPDLSLAFILWTAVTVIVSLTLWLLSFIVFKVSSKIIHIIRLEHIIFALVFVLFPLFIKRTFYETLSISNFIGLDRYIIVLIVLIMSVLLFWFFRNRTDRLTETILHGVNSRITPLVWLFALALILAIPLTFLKNNPPMKAYDLVTAKGENDSLANDHHGRPNIILVIMDSLYAGDMQLYGYHFPTTPFISDWAKDAVVFTRHYASSNYTTPATMSLLTGQRTWTHRIWYMAYNHPVGNYESNLPQVMKNNGYDVYGYVQNGNAHPVTLGLQEAFLTNDHYMTFELSKDWWFSRFKYLFPNRPIVNKWIFSDSFIAKRINSGSPVSGVTLKPPELVYDRFLENVLALKEEKRRNPFFAYLHVMPPHYAYLPSEPFMGWLGNEDRFNTDEKQWRNFVFNKAYETEKQGEVDILKKRYDEFILYSDKQFEMFLSRLAESVDMSNTIVILSSDHGESFSHEWLAHVGPHLYEPLVHIPLIFKLPGNLKGRVVDLPADQVDVAPTILELAGIPVPEWIEGRSLFPLIKGAQMDPLPVFSAYLQKNRSFGDPISKGTVAVWEGDYKLIFYIKENKSLLFNLKKDPGEKDNIADVEPETVKKLRRLIELNIEKANAGILQSINIGQ